MRAQRTISTSTKSARGNAGWYFRSFVGVSLASVISLSTTSLVAKNPSVDYDKVREDIIDILENEDYDDGSLGPVFVRLAWHASGTYSMFDKKGGSSGGRIRHSPEKQWGANAGLDKAMAFLEPIKKKHPGITYADLYTLAGAVAIEACGGPAIPWSPGRSDEPDGKESPPDGRLPDAARGVDHIKNVFYRQGFTDQETVALIGAHCMGRCHTDRSGYDGPWNASPTVFSNMYFVELLNRHWQIRKWKGPEQYEDKEEKKMMMLPADMALLEDAEYKKWVEIYAKDEQRFFQDFAVAFGKLLANGVKAPAKKSGWF